MRPLITLVTVLALLFCSNSCRRKEQDLLLELDPVLVFESNQEDANYHFTAARNIACDNEGSLYIFDYMDNTIKKYDKNGEHVITFGGQGEEEGQFSHLMDIRVFGDKLYALDSVATLVFDLQGQLLAKRPFQEEIVMEFPQIYKDGRFVGEQYSDAELKKILTLRDPEGVEQERLAEFDLRDFFPELEQGNDFFLQDYQARFYLYAFRPNGELIWAASDAGVIHVLQEGVSDDIILQKFTPLAIPADRVAAMKKSAERAKQNPMLHMYVPEYYQIFQHLLAAPNGDIWVYVMSAEKSGFLVFSSEGAYKHTCVVNADFDMTRVKIQMFDEKLFYLVTGRDRTRVYASSLPST